MEREEAITTLCKLQRATSDVIGWDHAADCFCAEGKGHRFDYQNSGRSVDYIVTATQRALVQTREEMDLQRCGYREAWED